MTAALSDNNDVGYVTDMTTELPILSPTVAPTADSFHKKVVDSNDRLCFVSYKGANTLRPRWYLVQILLDGDDADRPPGTYHIDFFRCHPDDMHKSHDIARWWPDWYEIKWVDEKEKNVF